MIKYRIPWSLKSNHEGIVLFLLNEGTGNKADLEMLARLKRGRPVNQEIMKTGLWISTSLIYFFICDVLVAIRVACLTWNEGHPHDTSCTGFDRLWPD